MRFWNPFRSSANQPEAQAEPAIEQKLTVTPSLRGFDSQGWVSCLSDYLMAYNGLDVDRTARVLIKKGEEAAKVEKKFHDEAEGQRVSAESERQSNLIDAKNREAVTKSNLNQLRSEQYRLDSVVKRLLRKCNLGEIGREISSEAIEALIARTVEAKNPPIVGVADEKERYAWAHNFLKLVLLSVAGIFVGITGGHIFKFVSLRDLREWDLNFTVIMAFLAGQGFVFGVTICCWLLTKQCFENHNSAKMNERPLSDSEKAIIAACLVIMVMLIIVELTVEAFGLQGLFTEWSATMKRRNVQVEKLPLFLYYCFGGIVSFPLIIITISETWRKSLIKAKLAEKEMEEAKRELRVKKEIEAIRSLKEIEEAKIAADESEVHRLDKLNAAERRLRELQGLIAELEAPVYLKSELVQGILRQQEEIHQIESQLKELLRLDSGSGPSDPTGVGSPVIADWMNNP